MTDRKWFIVRTSIQSEARAARSLRAERIRVYVPKMRMTTYHHRTKKRIDKHFVLFNRYMFIGLPANALHFGTVRSCDGVESILGVNGKPFEVSRHDVERFMMAQRGRQFDKLDPRSRKEAATRRYKPGSSIRVRTSIKDHPFGGLYGQVVKVKGKGIVQAMIRIFGGLVPIDLQPQDIEPVDDQIAA